MKLKLCISNNNLILKPVEPKVKIKQHDQSLSSKNVSLMLRCDSSRVAVSL